MNPVDLANLFIGLAGILLALAVYRLSRLQLRDSWLRIFGEIHAAFWTDEDIEKIRHCLAYSEAYEPLGKVLERRRDLHEGVEGAAELSQDEYKLLDRLDKFLNLLARAIGVKLEFSWRRKLWQSLFFQFWLSAAMDPKKPELTWYLEEFYSGLIEAGLKLDAK